MKKKIFVTIDLSDEIKESFRKEESRWKNLHIFWTGFSHLHLTFEYLGIIDKEDLKKIRRAVREVSRETKIFDIKLNSIVLGPNAKEPRMFWATIFEDALVKNLRKELKRHLEENEFEYQEKDFVPHIVLASAKGNQLKGKQTNVRLKGKIKVENLNIFSSQTYAKDTVKYKLLESFPLQK